jgi:hypothetical protein
MTLSRKGLILAAFQCLLVLSLSGKLWYDRSTCPRVWVKTAQWDPNLPIRGRYLALRLAPGKDAQWYAETSGQMVLFFVPERRLPFERRNFGPKSRFRTRVRPGRSGWPSRRKESWNRSRSIETRRMVTSGW